MTLITLHNQHSRNTNDSSEMTQFAQRSARVSCEHVNLYFQICTRWRGENARNFPIFIQDLAEMKKLLCRATKGGANIKHKLSHLPSPPASALPSTQVRRMPIEMFETSFRGGGTSFPLDLKQSATWEVDVVSAACVTFFERGSLGR